MVVAVAAAGPTAGGAAPLAAAYDELGSFCGCTADDGGGTGCALPPLGMLGKMEGRMLVPAAGTLLLLPSGGGVAPPACRVPPSAAMGDADGAAAPASR